MKLAAKPLHRWGQRLFLCAAVTLSAGNANALTVVNQPWVLPAAAGRSSEVYMNLTSTDGATLVAVRTDAAAAITLQMPGRSAHAATELALPARAIVVLAPGQYRFALHRLVGAVRLGDVVSLTLTLQTRDGSREDIPVNAVARLRSPVDDERRALHHEH
jgi:copper(I)-binding protein